MPIKRYPREVKKLTELNKAPYNPRTISDTAKKGLRKSLESLGDLQPIVWNKRSGNIVSGHQRYDILNELGESDAEVIVVDFTEQQELKANLEMNNPNITGEFEEAKLADVLDKIKLSEDYEDLMLHELEPVDLVKPPPPKPTILKPFNKTHVLLTMELNVATDFMADLTDLLKQYPDIETEVGSN